MLNGLWSNGMADPKETRQEVERIEEQFNQAIADIYGYKTERDIDLTKNPFYAASSIYKNRQPKLQDKTADMNVQTAQKLLVLNG